MKSKIIKSLVVALFLCATFFVFNKSLVHGATRNVLYLEVNEKWTVSVSSVSNPKIYKLGDDDKKIVSASISNKKLTIKPIKAGTCTFYLCKNNAKNGNSDIVRTIKLYSYGESSNLTPTLKNNISHSANDDDNYSNQTVICYSGRGFTLSISASGMPDIVDANATGGAKGYVASSIYECANANGTDKGSGAKWYLSGNVMASRSRYFSAGNVNTLTDTYVKGCVKWVSSNGITHWSKYRVIKVRVFPCPYINAYNSNGSLINSLNCVIGEPQKITYDVANIGAYTFDVESIIISNPSKAEIGESDKGGIEIIPLSKTSIPTYFKITLKVNHGSIPDYNGDEYCVFTKNITLNISNLPTPILNSVINVSNGLKINYDFVNGASSYKIVRATSKYGNYEEIGRTTEKYFLDETASYNISYFYKVCALGVEGDDDEPVESLFSEVKSVSRYVFAPSIDSVKSVGSGLYQIKINSIAKYSGYEVYVNGNLQVITDSKYATIKLNTGIYKIKVKAYKTVGKKKVYSKYSKIFKKTVRPKKPKVKKMFLRGRWVITLKKQKNINGFIIKYSKSKKFKKYKTKRVKKNIFKIVRKYKYVKINAYKKIGNTYLFSKTKKYKLKLKR